MEKLKGLQKLFRDKMANLQEIRNIEYAKLTQQNRDDRDALLDDLEQIRSEIDDLKRYNELAALDTPDPDDLEPDFSGAFN